MKAWFCLLSHLEFIVALVKCKYQNPEISCSCAHTSNLPLMIWCFIGCSFSLFGETEGGWLLFRVVSIHVIWSIIICFIWYSLLISFLFSRSKVHSYDEVVERVARRIGLDDPSKIRLTSHNCYSQQPKPQPIKYRGVEHLSDMLVHYNQACVTWI